MELDKSLFYFVVAYACFCELNNSYISLMCCQLPILECNVCRLIMDSFDSNVVQDFGMELGDIVLFLKLLLWVKLEHPILKVVYTMIYGLYHLFIMFFDSFH
jgi:hypothetical protein